MEDIVQQIDLGSHDGQKTYTFDEKHDRNLPTQMWFQNSEEGLILFIVFYTQACRWSRCLGCNLPARSSRFHVDFQAIMNQVDHVFVRHEVLNQRQEIRKIIISNNGSVFDEETFSSTALMYLLSQINIACPNLEVLTLETRPEYVDFSELVFLQRALREGKTPTNLEVAIGFEAFDDRIRNDFYKKGLSLDVFEKFVKKTARFGFRIKCYLMQKPVPGMTDQEAIQDIRNAIDYLSQMTRKFKARINIHLNPTYVAHGTILEKHFRRYTYTPPKLVDVIEAVKYAENKNLSVFVGLYDEGLAVEGGSFIRPGDEELAQRLEQFNRTQDYSILIL